MNVMGVDSSEKSIDIAKTLVGDAAICGTLDDLPQEKRFDAVTLINVPDHMVDGGRQLEPIRNLLNPGGPLYLRFPNSVFYTFILHVSAKLSVNRYMNDFMVIHEYAVTHRAINVFCGTHISPKDDTAMENLASFLIRASFSQERMQHPEQEGKVDYKSKYGKTTKDFLININNKPELSSRPSRWDLLRRGWIA